MEHLGKRVDRPLRQRTGYGEVNPTSSDAIPDWLVHRAYQLNLKGESVPKRPRTLTQTNHRGSKSCSYFASHRSVPSFTGLPICTNRTKNPRVAGVGARDRKVYAICSQLGVRVSHTVL